MKRVVNFAPSIKNRFRPALRYCFRYKKVLILILIVGLIGFGISKSKKVTGSPTAVTNGVQTNGNPTLGINKEYNFPIYNKGKKTENNLKMVVTTVERSDKILINGKPASAKDGKDFLIINLEISNPTQDKLNIRPVDFFRLVDDQGNQFAADVHNDPVKAEPISIKKTRIGFLVDEKQKSFKCLVGEINGEKQEVIINI